MQDYDIELAEDIKDTLSRMYGTESVTAAYFVAEGDDDPTAISSDPDGNPQPYGASQSVSEDTIIVTLSAISENTLSNNKVRYKNFRVSVRENDDEATLIAILEEQIDIWFESIGIS